MSELKSYKLFHRASALTSPEFLSVVEFGNNDEVYDKDEADKVIAEKDREIAELKERVQEERSAKVDYKISANDMRDGLEKAYAEIKYHKYKRCLDKAELCKLQYDNFFKIHSIGHMQMSCGRTKRTLYRKWYKRWLELAEKFKPNSTAPDRAKEQ